MCASHRQGGEATGDAPVVGRPVEGVPRRSKTGSALHVGRYVLAMTGMRRGELLAPRWRDIDLEARTLSIGRSVGVVRVKGQKEYLKEGDTKTTKPRVDLDEATVALLKAHKRERGGLALKLARDDALVLGNTEGEWRHSEGFSRSFKERLARCRKQLERAVASTFPTRRLHICGIPTPRSCSPRGFR